MNLPDAPGLGPPDGEEAVECPDCTMSFVSRHCSDWRCSKCHKRFGLAGPVRKLYRTKVLCPSCGCDMTEAVHKAMRKIQELLTKDCETCEGTGEIPQSLADQIAADRAAEAAIDRAVEDDDGSC